MQQAEALSLEQIRAFLEGSEQVAFEASSRAAKYALMEALLRRHHYAELGRPDKGLVRRFLQQLSGLSRVQTTRLIGQFLRQRTVCPTAYRRRRFPTRYTPADIVLLARVDEEVLLQACDSGAFGSHHSSGHWRAGVRGRIGSSASVPPPLTIDLGQF